MDAEVNPTLVELADVSFSYNQQRAVQDATFSIERGDFAGLIGPNGAGKTTIVKLILGLLKPDSGSIKLFGEDLSQFKDWKRIGYVPQKAIGFDQNFPATVLEVASMGRISKAGMFHPLSQEDNGAVEKALSLVDISPLRNRRIGELSGGHQQRVFIARALAAEPDLIILDEPTVGVDAEVQHSFYELLKKLNKEFGMTLILISHDIGIVSKNVNKLVCVNIKVKMHDVRNGINESELRCAYTEGMEQVPHHH